MFLTEVVQETTATKGLANDIQEYGPFAVILAIFLIVFLIVIKKIMSDNSKNIDFMSKTMSDFMNNIMNQNNIMLNKIYSQTSTTVESMKTPEYDKDIVGAFSKCDASFKKECKNIIEATGAARAAIYVFHNGSTASHGLPFFKMSCINEFTERNTPTKRMAAAHKDIPLTLYSEIVESIYYKGNTVINCKEDDTDFASSEEVQILLLAPVYDDDNRVMAFFAAEYLNELTKESIEDYFAEMEKHCERIRPVIQFSDFYGKEE